MSSYIESIVINEISCICFCKKKKKTLLFVHLQFAEDTFLLGEKSLANVRALKAVLILFKVISELKANFHKSMLVEVNVVESWMLEGSLVMNCRMGRIPFLYLGLPIGGDPRRFNF